MTLYIDAHVEPNTTPVIKLPGGKTFSQSSLWTDLYSAIREAKHIIYIAGARLCAMPRGRVDNQPKTPVDQYHAVVAASWHNVCRRLTRRRLVSVGT